MRSAPKVIERNCGHSEKIRIYFENAADRERKVEYFSRFDCTECIREQKQKKDQEQTEKFELITLKGSEKQIAWGNRIRLEHFANLKKHLSLEEINTKDDSRFYIDNRNYLAINDKSIIECIFFGKEIEIPEFDYPELIGTEKQISYAKDLRKKLVLSVIANEVTDCFAHIVVNMNISNVDNDLYLVLSKIKDAKWWIENRPTCSDVWYHAKKYREAQCK